jgi:hypothetical protein
MNTAGEKSGDSLFLHRGWTIQKPELIVKKIEGGAGKL